MSVADVVEATKLVHEFLRAQVGGGGPISELVDDDLAGGCATAAHLLIDLLGRGELVITRTVFGNAMHVSVLVDGLHADPTRLQFRDDQPWLVSAQAPTVDHWGGQTTWAVEPLPRKWQADQHPRTHYPLLGLGEFSQGGGDAHT